MEFKEYIEQKNRMSKGCTIGRDNCLLNKHHTKKDIGCITFQNNYPDEAEKIVSEWAKEHHSAPFLGLMASEGGRRAKTLMLNGCNYFGESTIRSCPFAIFNRQDILQLAIDLHTPVPEIYGEIKRKDDGTLYTTKAQRTGCNMCGFGIHLEKRPNRFDMLKERNPKEWDYWMFRCCTDENGNKYGWAKVLDYIGVGYDDIPEQLSLFDKE